MAEGRDSDEVLTEEDKALFLAEWDLAEGEMTDRQILMAIKNGYL